MALLQARSIPRQTLASCLCSWFRLKTTLDYSLVPKFEEKDIEEQFVRGSGPGGSAVNKNSNCVVLKHTPSGVVIKCHSSRDLQTNRKTARELLIRKLDELANGDRSIAAQKKAIEKQKSLNAKKKRDKLDVMKQAWKAREGLD